MQNISTNISHWIHYNIFSVFYLFKLLNTCTLISFKPIGCPLNREQTCESIELMTLFAYSAVIVVYTHTLCQHIEQIVRIKLIYGQNLCSNMAFRNSRTTNGLWCNDWTICLIDIPALIKNSSHAHFFIPLFIALWLIRAMSPEIR